MWVREKRWLCNNFVRLGYVASWYGANAALWSVLPTRLEAQRGPVLGASPITISITALASRHLLGRDDVKGKGSRDTERHSNGGADHHLAAQPPNVIPTKTAPNTQPRDEQRQRKDIGAQLVRLGSPKAPHAQGLRPVYYDDASSHGCWSIMELRKSD